MNFGELDDEIKRIIEKANAITQIEDLQSERIKKLSELRERDGKLKIAIQEKSKEIVKKKNDRKAAINILQNNKTYFQLLDQYSGDELLEKLEEEIENYSWDRYSKLQDELYRLTKDKSPTELQSEIDQLQIELDELEEKRSELVDYSLRVLREIDDELDNTKNKI